MVERRYALIGVEGNHDQAFLCRVLEQSLGFKKFNGKESELDNFWRKFVPIYPSKTAGLYKRLDMPSVIYKGELSVAIYVGEGSNLIKNLQAKLSDIDYHALFAFGIVADADKQAPNIVAKNYSQGFIELFPKFPEKPNVIIESSTRLGSYVFPDNSNQGVVDTLLCKCGESAYPEFMRRAKSYVDQFSETEIKEIGWKPFDKEKAIVATVASVLKPGKTNTVSIADNKWICPETIAKVSELNSIVSFLKNLLMVDTTNSSTL